MKSILHATMEVASCDARFFVNDLAVGVLRHRRSVFQALPIHEFLVRGDNTLRIERLDTPAPAATLTDGDSGPAAVASAGLTVAAYQPGMTPGHDPAQAAGSVVFRSTDSEGQVALAANGRFSLGDWPLRWSWESLPPANWLAEAPAHAVFQFLQWFVDRFKAGDAGAVAAALRPKMSDYCQAYGLDLRAETSDLAARMARRLADPSFDVLPFAASDLALRPCAGGRLVDCVLSSGEPVIRWRDARVGDRGAMALRLGLSGQQLLVYR